MKSRILHILLLLLFICSAAFSQEKRVVSGVIRDGYGDPIIGVNVIEKGTSNGKITDIDGYYEIIVPLGSTVQFSFIGMKTSEMKVTESNSKPAGGGSPAPVSKPVPVPQVEVKDADEEEERSSLLVSDGSDKSLSPYFLVKSDSPREARMPLRKTDVEVSIAGVIADVCVKQLYVNESPNTLEAIYVFPGSTRAAVYGMSMTIGERRIDAKIRKKEQARKEYEQAKEEGKSTTLLEQQRPNVFQMNVANILPGDTIIVEMRYTELLEHQGGLYEFVYPTIVGPRYSESGEKWVDRPVAQFESGETPQFSIRTVIQAGMPIRKISSSSHSLAIESALPDRAIVSLSNPKDFEGDRDYILHYDLQGGKVESGMLCYEHGDEHFFLLMMQPPKKPTIDQIPPREYVFIVDFSGSMHGYPLDISKELIRNLASALRPVDRFNVMLFESSNAMLYSESVPATEAHIRDALAVIDNQKGSGGTRLYPAIVNAMNFKETKGFSRTFIVATDGFVTVEKEAFAYIRDHLNEANLFPFGIGSSVNRYMIEGLAHAGMGSPYIVTNYTEAEAIGKKAIEEISQPVLTNISIDWDEFDVYDVEPVAIPDVFAQRPILVYGKYRSPAKGRITVSGIAGDSMYVQEFNVSEAPKENNQGLRYLWARNQIRYYDDYAQYYEGDTNTWSDDYGNHQRSTQQVEQVTNLGLKYNLLTQYTSFLAVDDEVRVPEPVRKETKTSSRSPISKLFSSSSRSSSSSYQGSGSTSSTPQSVSSPDVQLSEDASLLEEVVVVSYGTSRKSELTGGVSSVSSGEMISSVAHSLQGRVAGLEVAQTSGEPDDQARIRIRGTGSIMDNSSPLVVLDGVPVEYASMQHLNPNEIESVSVLKDASSAALYGSRAANGVLVITSKSPQYKKLSISWNSSFSIETPNQLPELQRQFAQGRPENGSPVWNPADEPFSWGPDVNPFNASTYDAFDFLRTGLTFKNYLMLSGRENKYHFNMKFGNNTQQGFFPDSKFSENSFSLRVGNDMGSKLGYDFDFGYKNTRGNRLQRGYNRSGIMQGILLTPPTFDNGVSATLDDGSQRSAGNAADNPYWTVDNNPFSDEADRFTGSLMLTYSLIQPLLLEYQLSGDYLSGDAKTALNKGSNYYNAGHVMNRYEKFRSVDSRFSVKYNQSWNDLTIRSTVGHAYSNSGRAIDRTDGYHLPEPGNYSIQHADSIAFYNQSLYRYSHALFGKADFDYRQLLILQAGARGEWSSVNNEMLFSPSVGFAVNFHELFYSDLLTYLKLYVNTSRVDKETPLYLAPVYFNSAIYNLNDASQHFENREVALGSLKPESIRHYEVGANVGLWNNRLRLSASWFQKNGKDQLLPVQVSTSVVRLENGGVFRTRGFEVELEAQLIQNRDFFWHTRLAFSRERNRAIRLGGKQLMLAGIEGVAGSYAIEGQPLGVLAGTAYQRDEQGQMLIGSDGFPIKNPELQILGDPNPDWRMGWNHSLGYRNFSLSFVLDFKKGGKMWNGTRSAMNYYGTSRYSADHRNTANYVFPGVLSDGRMNDILVNFYGNTLNENRWVRYGEYGIGEDGIEDASSLKLREISLGYRVPLRIGHNRTQVKVSVFATNVLVYSKYKGVDPETNLTGSSNGFGLDYFNIPGAQSAGVSLNWEF